EADVSESLIGEQFSTMAACAFLLEDLISSGFAVCEGHFVSLDSIVLTVSGDQRILILGDTSIDPVGGDIFISKRLFEQDAIFGVSTNFFYDFQYRRVHLLVGYYGN